MPTLLEKARKLNRLLQLSETVEYPAIARVLCNTIGANIYITESDGRILGYALSDGFECNIMIEKVIDQKKFPSNYANWLLKFDETAANLQSKSGRCAFVKDTACMFSNKCTTIVPIYGVGERVGTLIAARFKELFTDGDLLLAEYGAMVVGMEMMQSRTRKFEIDARDRAAVQIALATLSYSEIEAAVAILKKLDGSEGLLVASKVADEVGITRSVIVNALRKIESAGVIESKSLGMKGTYIKVLNGHLLDEVRKMQH